MFGKPFPDEKTQAMICAHYASGARLIDAAQQSGYCLTTVKRVLERNGMAARRRGKAKGEGPVRSLDDAGLVKFKEMWDRLDSTVKGTIAENYVKTKLSELGFDVWEPSCQNHKTDLVILLPSKTMRIQVKSATYDIKIKSFRANVSRHRREGKLQSYNLADVDFFVVYCGGLPKLEFYVIPAELVIGRTDLKLYPHRPKTFGRGPEWEKYRNAFSLLSE